jgi:hypothetical protein
MESKKLFGDMEFGEIEKWEKDVNAIVIFDDERGIAFQKTKDDEPGLAILDDLDVPVFIIFENDIQRLKEYLNENF